LNEGDSLGELRVTFIGAVTRGHVAVEAKDPQGHGTELIVTRQGDGALPPVTTKKYALFYSSIMSDAGAPSMEAVKAGLEALGDRIRKVEDTTPEPPGLSTYGAAHSDI
jgi:hypothetical protein